MRRRGRKGIFYIIILALLVLLGRDYIQLPPAMVEDTEGRMVVSFIDVGQGDSTFLEFPGGTTMLIDAGEAEAGDRVISYLRQRHCTRLDYVICTHPHSDHIGGMAKVLNSFDVGAVYMPRVSHNSKAFEKLLLAIQNKGLSIQTVKAGVTLEIEPEIGAVFLAPVSQSYEELNDYSAVLRLTYKSNAFLFTGDAQRLSEEEMLSAGGTLAADVLKVGHHGSSSSSHKQFLHEVSPRWAVISCGADNDYGHPHQAVVNRLEKMDVTMFRTDIDGTVVAASDGETITFLDGEE